MKVNVSLRLRSKDTLEKIEMAKTIVLKMTGNANFPSPNPTLATLTTVADDCDKAVTAADKGNDEQKAKLAKAELLLDSTLSQMGDYVNNIANGNDVIILSAGMGFTHPRTAPQIPDAPQSLTIANANVHLALKIRWDVTEFARSYVIEMNEDETMPVNGWKIIHVQTQRLFVTDALTSGKVYSFRVKVVGVLGMGLYSSAVQCRVL